MAQIKGTAILGTIKYIKEQDSAGGVEALVAGLDPSVRSVFDERIQSLLWYPYPAYAGLLEAVDRELGRDDLTLMPELGRFAAEADIRGFWKAMVSLFSPRRILTQTDYFWRKHCDTGVFEATDVAPRSGAVELRDFPAVSPAHCRLLIGWLNGIGLAIGAKNEVVEKTACVHRGDSCCRYEMWWD